MEKGKATKLEMFERVYNVVSNYNIDEELSTEEVTVLRYQEELEFIEKQIEAVKKQNASRKTSTKQLEKQHETTLLKAFLYDNLTGYAPQTVTEIVKLFPEKEFTSQKVTYLLRSLLVEGKAVRSTLKGVSYYEII